MSTNLAAGGGLSTAELDTIRESLAAGRKPKVMFTEAAGQIAGEVGQVVKLTDPEHSDEWVVVRFGKDELPFSPTDLVVPPRGRPGKPTKAAAADDPGPSAAAPADPTAQPADVPAVPEPRSDSNPGPAAGTPAGAKPAKRAAKAARTTKPKAPSALSVTLAYEAGEWTVAAYQGSKTLAKPYVVRATEALKMVGMLDVPGVHDAVEAIVSAELAEASQRAEQLRGELAEVEARLAELRDVG